MRKFAKLSPHNVANKPLHLGFYCLRIILTTDDLMQLTNQTSFQSQKLQMTTRFLATRNLND